MSEHYEAALADWKAKGGTRPRLRPDGILTRIDFNWHTPAEKAITDAMYAIEAAGASEALTNALTLLSQARHLVANHVEAEQDR